MLAAGRFHSANHCCVSHELTPLHPHHILDPHGSALHLQSSDARNLSTVVNLVTLSDLKAWTWYCVVVQTRNKNYWKESSFTSQQCIQTKGEASVSRLQ